jgi:hypothetical protein
LKKLKQDFLNNFYPGGNSPQLPRRFMRPNKKTRIYITHDDEFKRFARQPTYDKYSFNGWFYRGYVICRGYEINPQSVFEKDTWFRSVEPYHGEAIMDVEFKTEHAGWETINCIMDNVDDAIDQIPMDKHDGVHWMVGFRTGNQTGSVRMIVPFWGVDDARKWVMDMTGHYVGSMTRVFMGEQPRVIAKDGNYDY